MINDSETEARFKLEGTFSEADREIVTAYLHEVMKTLAGTADNVSLRISDPLPSKKELPDNIIQPISTRTLKTYLEEIEAQVDDHGQKIYQKGSATRAMNLLYEEGLISPSVSIEGLESYFSAGPGYLADNAIRQILEDNSWREQKIKKAICDVLETVIEQRAAGTAQELAIDEEELVQTARYIAFSEVMAVSDPEQAKKILTILTRDGYWVMKSEADDVSFDVMFKRHQIVREFVVMILLAGDFEEFERMYSIKRFEHKSFQLLKQAFRQILKLDERE